MHGYYFPARGGNRMVSTLIRDAKRRYVKVSDEDTGRVRHEIIGELSRNDIYRLAMRRPRRGGIGHGS